MKEYLEHKVKDALKKMGVDKSEFTFERPKEEKFGDLSTNTAMLLAKELKKNPREIAGEIISNMELPDPFIKDVNIAGAGFINFFISNDYYTEQLKKILSSSESYGKSSLHQGETANIEWVSANPTGPLHAGHGRHIALGKAVANLLEWTGYKLIREYYYNDAGKQMENLAKSVYARYRQFFEPGFKLPEDAYAGEYVTEIAKLIEKEQGNKLINSENDLDLFKTAGENWCFKSIRHTLNRIGITHDIFFSEQSLYKEGKINYNEIKC